jgi:hypothetical protein
MSREVEHPRLGEAVDAIGGSYWLLEEKEVLFLRRRLLFWVGVGVVDRSCCGTGGCRYILVPGFVEEWKWRREGELEFSKVEPISSTWLQQKITEMLRAREKVEQVQFLS